MNPIHVIKVSIPREIIANHIVPYINDVGVLNAVLNCLPRGLVTVEVIDKLKDKFAKFVDYTNHKYYVLPNGNKHGLYQVYKNGKCVKISMFKDDKLHGLDTSYFTDDIIIRSKYEYLNGSRNGPYSTYYRGGNVAEQGFYKDNQYDGQYMAFESSHVCTKLVEYIDGKRHGKYCKWNGDDGSLIYIKVYANDLIQSCELYENGKLYRKTTHQYMFDLDDKQSW